MPSTLRFDGAIAGIGTESGLRVVVGMWPRSPYGDVTDVMLQHPDDRRTLLAPTRPLADFIASTYTFDEVRVVPVHRWREGSSWTVLAGGLSLTFEVGARTRLGGLLTWVPREISTLPAFSTAVDPIARRVLKGVRTRGTAKEGRTEYYAALDQHRITAVTGAWNGRKIGDLRPVEPPVTFGFGSTPREPSLVRVVTTIREA